MMLFIDQSYIEKKMYFKRIVFDCGKWRVLIVASAFYNMKYKALLLDAGGTLLQTAKPVEETYAAYGLKYGVAPILNF